MGHAVMLNAVDIPLADPLDLTGAVRVAQLCDWGANTGLPFRANILIFHWRCLPMSARRRRQTTAIDTHWIWREGDCRLTKIRWK